MIPRLRREPRWPAPWGMRRLLPNLPELVTNDNKSLVSRLRAGYDSGMYSPLVREYYDYSDFHNYGYWYPQTANQREASENLVDLLVGFMPNKAGTILDVACGMGASTQRLLRSYAPSNITGINISEKQLATCRTKAPGCRFLNMDATELRFPSDSFTNILCVEAAFHFETREDFFHEAFRVLKPGGCLALSDILLRSGRLAFLATRQIPLANFVDNVEKYRQVLRRCGFEDVRIIEAQHRCWELCKDHWLAFLLRKVLAGEAPRAAMRKARLDAWFRDQVFNNYLLVSACKPEGFTRTTKRATGDAIESIVL
jgi:MPBQ/MSBQ methyltransferase